jgi:hypothetical protein
LNNHLLHGTIGKEKEHHYGYTKKSYKDFELNVMIKMVGDDDANSGVCVGSIQRVGMMPPAIR